MLVGEGDQVTAGQELVRLTRQPGERPMPGPLRHADHHVASSGRGVVTRSTAVVGATASAMPGEPLFRIAVDGEIELEAEVPSVHVPELASGQTARIEIEGGRELSGRFAWCRRRSISARNSAGRGFRWSRHPALRLGMFARATIDANRSCGISVPALAPCSTAPRARACRSCVTTSSRRGWFRSDSIPDYDIEIRDGLREGDMVVANAGSSLRDGDKVKPIVAERLANVAA